MKSSEMSSARWETCPCPPGGQGVALVIPLGSAGPGLLYVNAGDAGVGAGWSR